MHPLQELSSGTSDAPVRMLAISCPTYSSESNRKIFGPNLLINLSYLVIKEAVNQWEFIEITALSSKQSTATLFSNYVAL